MGIFSGPSSESRRALIRSTWATRFPNPAYEYRFIIGNHTDDPYGAVIEAENKTHGDIWAIEDYKVENSETANMIKNLEWFKYMQRYEGERVRRYAFVSKVDDDNWLNVPQYFETFVAPRLAGGKKHNPKGMTIIGRPMNWGAEYAYPSGRMYTVDWPMLEFFAQKYTENPNTGETEDRAMGLYLYENHIPFEYVPVEVEQAFDVGIEYLIDNNTMQIHSMKHDDTLKEVSELFDDRGHWNGKLVPGLTSFDRNYKEVIFRIGQPDEEEQELLQSETKKPGYKRPDDEWETIDWKLIQKKISVEDREVMGDMYPLNLPGNNVSTDVVPRQLGWCDGSCAHKVNP